LDEEVFDLFFLFVKDFSQLLFQSHFFHIALVWFYIYWIDILLLQMINRNNKSHFSFVSFSKKVCEELVRIIQLSTIQKINFNRCKSHLSHLISQFYQFKVTPSNVLKYVKIVVKNENKVKKKKPTYSKLNNSNKNQLTNNHNNFQSQLSKQQKDLIQQQQEQKQDNGN